MNEDLHCSHGPVSTMPGSSHHLPEGTRCDRHDDRPAVTRMQGETDSFGCEYVCMCQECLDEYRAHMEAERNAEHCCDWCKALKTNVRPYRDMDEGSAGPLYQVCGDCRAKDQQRFAEELDDEPYSYDDGWL